MTFKIIHLILFFLKRICIMKHTLLFLIIVLFCFSKSNSQNSVFSEDYIKNPERKFNSFYKEKKEKKSAFLAVVYSLILPGAGEYYAGRFDVGKYSLAGEAALWILYTGMNIHGYQVRNDGRAFARLHAGFDDENKNDDYYVNVSNFMNTFDFNEKRLRDRDYKSLYDPFSNMAWNWDSDENRRKFRDMRVRADEIINNTKFVAIAMIANRIFSAVNAARFVSNYNSDLNISLNPIGFENRYDGFLLKISTNF